MSDFPRFFGFSDAKLYITNTAPIRGSRTIPLRRDRRRSDSYEILWRGPDIAARMYRTDIVVWKEDGTILVDEYDSATTTKVQNQLLPSDCSIHSNCGHKHLGIYPFTDTMELVNGPTGWLPTPESHGYCYGPGRKFVTPELRAYYEALRKLLVTTAKISQEACKGLPGTTRYGSAQDVIQQLNRAIKEHNWKPGTNLPVEMIEEGLSSHWTDDRLSNFQFAKWEYKGITKGSSKWGVMDYQNHLKTQAFLDSFKK